jgi:hypothetical protein
LQLPYRQRLDASEALGLSRALGDDGELLNVQLDREQTADQSLPR